MGFAAFATFASPTPMPAEPIGFLAQWAKGAMFDQDGPFNTCLPLRALRERLWSEAA
jgi:hypothetical protein